MLCHANVCIIHFSFLAPQQAAFSAASSPSHLSHFQVIYESSARRQRFLGIKIHQVLFFFFFSLRDRAKVNTAEGKQTSICFHFQRLNNAARREFTALSISHT